MLHRTFIFFLLLLPIIYYSHKPNYANVEKHKTHKAVMIYSSSKTWKGPKEPSIFINPRNPKNIIAGSISNFFHYSKDGGKTWNTKTLSSPFGMGGDPCVIVDYMGVFYYFHLSNPGERGWESGRALDRIVVQKSKDKGKTWSKGTSIGENHPKDQDKEWATVNPFNNEIYVTWTEFDSYGSKKKKDQSRILFSKSSNEGKNWTYPSVVNSTNGDCTDGDQTVVGAVPATGLNNEIYTVWAFNNQLLFSKSKNGGANWEKEKVIANQPGGWVFPVLGLHRVNGLPVTVTDLSTSNFRGSIYVNWSDQRNGNEDTDVWLIYSRDHGTSWSDPVRVNVDSTKTHQFFNWITVDQTTGYLYVVFYDRSRYSDNQTDVVLAVSKDGGKTFTNETISEYPFTPKNHIFLGDYNNIHAHKGIIRPVWTQYDGKNLSVWTALINRN